MLIINDDITIQETLVKRERPYRTRGDIRSCIEIHIPAEEADEIKYRGETTLDEIFSDNAVIVWRVEDDTEEGYTDNDLSDFCVAGDIVDKRDGSYVVYMARKTETEKLLDTLVERGMLTAEEAEEIRGSGE